MNEKSHKVKHCEYNILFNSPFSLLLIKCFGEITDNWMARICSYLRFLFSTPTLKCLSRCAFRFLPSVEMTFSPKNPIVSKSSSFPNPGNRVLFFLNRCSCSNSSRQALQIFFRCPICYSIVKCSPVFC